MDDLKPSDPRVIGGIELRGRLGEGGMGAVYFGLTADGEQVAVKVIRDAMVGHQIVRERFNREIKVMDMIRGPGVAGLVAAAAEGEEPPWLAMEYVRGLTLRQYVEGRGTLAAAMGAALGDLLVEALIAVHTAKLLHRDLKPGNILLGSEGPKIIDFGLAGLLEALEDQELTSTNETFGTPVTMSPEQVESAKNLTPAADVYSLGATLIYALAGHFPYQRPNKNALFHAITDSNIAPDLSGLPPTLEPVIVAMVAHEPASRPTLAEAADEFRRVCKEAGLSPRDARVHLATLTFVKRDTDPPSDFDPPSQAWRRRPVTVPVPRPAIQALADRIRAAYATSTRL
ncbi:serine/threonine-protein kinase [Actinomadura rugatobispora]|uniref:Serine/threonine-protein kinase n=1 Tax=Actinomadura rugatobispora TaxID=1994 RepID=A0ABW1A907_9ACTN|nr:hypothetical protein GCM10010200_020670 [Actinomadura rugatobispora]